MAAKPGVWNPTAAPLPPLDDGTYQEPVLDRTHAPCKGLPGAVPYTYQGGDFTPAATVTVRPSRRKPPARNDGTPLDDPELLAADLPQSAPDWWHREIHAELEEA